MSVTQDQVGFRARLRAGGTIVTDGATATELLALGLPRGRSPEIWNLEHPDLVERVARRAIEAGAEIVTTNSFGASPIRLAQFGLAEETEAILVAAVAAARRAREASVRPGDPAVFVFGSCGPSGLWLPPRGDASPEEIRASFLTAISILVREGVDAIAIETMTDLHEALLCLDAAREATGGSIPIAATMAFPPARGPHSAASGEPIEVVLGALASAGAEIVGANCSPSIEEMEALARELREATDLPLYFRPSAGLPQDLAPLAYPETPQTFTAKALRLRDAGVAILGGCCGVSPDHIRLLAAALRARG